MIQLPIDKRSIVYVTNKLVYKNRIEYKIEEGIYMEALTEGIHKIRSLHRTKYVSIHNIHPTLEEAQEYLKNNL